jgi:hypothetical protein
VLFIVSVMLIFIPETRTPALEMNPVKAAFFALLGARRWRAFCRRRRSGVCSLTIQQIHEGIERGTIKAAGSTVLEFVSGTAAVVACTTGYWQG